MNELKWRKASASNEANCVEIAIDGSTVKVRDSKDVTGPVLTFDRDEWQAFVTGVKSNEFNL